MNKFILKPEYLDSVITTKTSDGTDIIVTKNDFNDYFAEMFIANGQHHLIKLNPHHKLDDSQKKTFTQILEDVILLTSNPLPNEEQKQSPTVNVPELVRPKRGRRQKAKI